MGRLKDRMKQLEKPAGDFLELARRVRKSRHWPKGDRLSQRSLATYLGKLDKGDMEWLEQRPGARKALADALDLELEDLDEHLGGTPPPSNGADGRIPLWDLKTHILDLRRDQLPPGIPPAVQDPRQWPCWWHAPSGSGRTLVGRWLEARGHATFIQAESWAEAESQLPTRGAVFVELTLASSVHTVPLQAPPNLAICIAADAPPPREPPPSGLRIPLPSKPSQWPRAVSQPLESWLQELVRWAAARIPPEEEFEPEACLDWLKKIPLQLGLIDGFGTALGFVGLFAEFGGKGARRRRRPLDQAETLSDLARLFLRMRLRRMDREGIEVRRDALWGGLLRLACGLLVRSRSPWNDQRPLAEWRSLAFSQPDAVDLQWLEELASRGRLKLEPSALKELRSELPPDAFRTVHVLQELQLLRKESPGQFAMRPQWFLFALVEQASTVLLDADFRAWGTALLQQHGAPLIIEALVERFHAGEFTLIQKLLKASQPDEPAWIAAVECAFRALGMALLEGAEVPESLREELFRAQLPLMIERWEYPVPRIDYSLSREVAPLLEQGLWHLAAFALSETLEDRLPPDASSLVPWAGKTPPKVLRDMLSRAEYACLARENPREELKLGAARLGGRLLEKVGPIPTGISDLNELQLPEALLRRFQHGQFTWDLFRDEHRLYMVMPLLRAYVEQRGESWSEFAGAIWKAWVDSLGDKHSELPQLFWFEQLWEADLWGALPVEVFQVLMERHHFIFGKEPGPYPYLKQEHWSVLLAAWNRLRDRLDAVIAEERFWPRVPAELLPQLMNHGVLSGHDHFPHHELWRRIPAEVGKEISQRITRGHWDEALRLAWYAPEEQTADVARRLSAGLSRGDAPNSKLVAWAHDRVARRTPGWERAWPLLSLPRD